MQPLDLTAAPPRAPRESLAAHEAYPRLGERPDLVPALDVLEEDDRQRFAQRN